ncbi:hypothetical protein DBB29_19530 [Pandoraea cepalis]|uniref:Uncharacterized protein n=2 Tax=Pandoraea cepalis TaxID=2508294 RepID=A0AAW7MPW3_9BURK|nr:hypothetical protein [Pandoraea cepalis]MDN4580300.1 hypothetical protein [Pandoraea cepalis]
MKLTRTLIVAGAFVSPVAHAQINQILGVIHSAQSAATQAARVLPQQSGQDSMQDDRRLAAQAQADQAARQNQAQQQEQSDNAAYRALREQRAAAGRQRAQQAVADQDAADIAKYKASQQRGQQEARAQSDQAMKVAAACPALVDEKYNVAERFIRCRNQGISMPQQMAFVGAMPILAQAYMASMVQDIYEDNVTSPAKGKAITDYYDGCYRRGTPCVRRRW